MSQHTLYSLIPTGENFTDLNAVSNKFQNGNELFCRFNNEAYMMRTGFVENAKLYIGPSHDFASVIDESDFDADALRLCLRLILFPYLFDNEYEIVGNKGIGFITTAVGFDQVVRSSARVRYYSSGTILGDSKPSILYYHQTYHRHGQASQSHPMTRLMYGEYSIYADDRINRWHLPSHSFGWCVNSDGEIKFVSAQDRIGESTHIGVTNRSGSLNRFMYSVGSYFKNAGIDVIYTPRNSSVLFDGNAINTANVIAEKLSKLNANMYTISDSGIDVTESFKRETSKIPESDNNVSNNSRDSSVNTIHREVIKPNYLLSISTGIFGALILNALTREYNNG